MRRESFHFPFAAFGLFAIVAFLTSVTALAGGFRTGPLVQVSGLSPFVGCTADDVAGQSGTNFLHSEVEPWVDVNPANPRNVVGAWQQDRWSNGGARGLLAGASFDGGRKWTSVVIPGITMCSGSALYQRATDPWVSFSPNGVVHQLALSFNDINPPFTTFDFDHALLASRSLDGGLTWSQPLFVIRDLDENVFNDKQSITADPADASRVYAVWDRLIFPPTERANIISGFVSFAFRGPAWFARTTNGGVSWEPARQIFDPGQESQTIGNQIVVLPNGDLVNVFDLITQRRPAAPQQGARARFEFFKVALLRSTDQGVTWSQQPVIVDLLRMIFVTDPETGDDVRTGDIIPEVAVDRNPASPGYRNLYVVWQDARFNGFGADAIAFSLSTDGGFTWTPAIKVNKTPTSIPIGNQQAFTPSVHVASDGSVGVTYYDFRNNTAAADLKTDYFIVHCHPTSATSCATGGNWVVETQLTDRSFDMRQAPFARGFFTGDYESLASIGTDFAAFFSQSHAGDPASVFFRRAGP